MRNTEEIEKEIASLRVQVKDLNSRILDLNKEKYDGLGLTEDQFKTQQEIDHSIAMSGFGVPVNQESEKPYSLSLIFNKTYGPSHIIELKELSGGNFEILGYPQFEGLTVNLDRVGDYTFRNHNTGKYVMQFRRMYVDNKNWAEHLILTSCNELHEMLLPHLHKYELEREINYGGEWLMTFPIIELKLKDLYDEDPNNWRDNFKECMELNSGEYSSIWKTDSVLWKK